jgi:3-methyl-2-oxobutanoate hydroxymethyltransferase
MYGRRAAPSAVRRQERQVSFRAHTTLGCSKPLVPPQLESEDHFLGSIGFHMSKPDGRTTVPAFAAMKTAAKKITMLTAYDFATASIVDTCKIEGILVGDSLSMVVQGNETTLPVTLDEMIYHAKMVCRAVRHSLVIVDMPFGSYHAGISETVGNAARIMKETGCQAVKLEGGADQADVIRALVSAGIPVMAHVGLRPQSVHQMGGYKMQRDEERLLADASAAESAGAFSMVLECVPNQIAARITGSVSIPTIGIGAGPDCDGQVLVLHDLLGMTSGYVPKFVKQYADLKTTMIEAVQSFRDEVRDGEFPASHK